MFISAERVFSYANIVWHFSENLAEWSFIWNFISRSKDVVYHLPKMGVASPPFGHNFWGVSYPLLPPKKGCGCSHHFGGLASAATLNERLYRGVALLNERLVSPKNNFSFRGTTSHLKLQPKSRPQKIANEATPLFWAEMKAHRRCLII